MSSHVSGAVTINRRKSSHKLKARQCASSTAKIHAHDPSTASGSAAATRRTKDSSLEPKSLTNLLINMRFYVKTKCKTYGLCTYDCLNLLFCSCCLHTLCRDRCFTLPTLFKWLVKTCVIGTTIYLIRQANSDWAQEREEEVDFGYVPTTEVSSLDTLLIVYVLQHPMFMVARIPIFIVYSLLTCCCDKGRNYPDDEEFKDRIISFDYVKYETDVH